MRIVIVLAGFIFLWSAVVSIANEVANEISDMQRVHVGVRDK